MNNILLALSEQEVLAILSVLGDLPTKVGSYPLMLKINKQLEDFKKELTDKND